MPHRSSRSRILAWLHRFAVLALLSSAARAVEWPKIDKAELAETASKIEPGADAEYLLRETTLDRFTYGQVDSNVVEGAGSIQITQYFDIKGMQDKHLIRVKVFTEKGVKAFSHLDVRYDDDAKITGLAARFIKPDGTVTEVKSEDFKDEEAGKNSKKKTCALQGLVPGSIIEYCYTESSLKAEPWAPLHFQKQYPTRRVVFKVLKVVPPPTRGAQKLELRTIAYNTSAESFTEKGKALIFEQTNVPSIRIEPLAPAPISTEMVIIVYLQDEDAVEGSLYWASLAKKEGHQFGKAIAKTPVISATLASIIADSDSDDQKLTKIHDWCRSSLVNRNRLNLTKEERAKLKLNKNISDVLDAKSGTSKEINLAFGALAKAAGFEVRLAAINNRTRAPFNKNLVEKDLMLPDRAIAVSQRGGWRFFNPGATFLPAGMVLPQHGDTYILICDPNGTEQPTRIPGPSADESVRERKGAFTLSSAGVLEGDVTETYTGLLDYTMKSAFHDHSADEQATQIRRQVQRRLPTAAVTNIVITDAANPVAPLSVTYHLRIPNYAKASDKHLVLQPAVFLKGQKPLLRDNTRKFPLVLPFRMTERNEVRIKIPDGYTVDMAPTPQGIDAEGLGRYDLAVRHNSETGEIVDTRERAYTGITYNPSSYTKVKAVLDQMDRLNSFTIGFVRDETAPATAQPTTQEQPEVSSQKPKTGSPSNAGDESDIDMLL
ncbi:MAG: DUF3857 domain-containing protein [Nibricoccus sp.]